MHARPGPAVLLAALLAASIARADPPTAPDTAHPPAAPPPQAAPDASTEAKPTPPNLETIGNTEAENILGKKVLGPSGEDMGLVVDVLVDGNGWPRAAVIDFGGFLGVGSRKIAIDWRLLKFSPDDPAAPVKLSLVRSDVQTAPEYKPGTPTIDIVAPPKPPPAPPPSQ